MLKLTLTRNETSDEGTFGLLEGEALKMYTGELPDKDNQVRISCIPPGKYLCMPHTSPKHGKCYWLKDVPGRTEILIHAGNWMGNSNKGFKSDLLGCIAIGMGFARDANEMDQDMITNSRSALAALFRYTGFRKFELEVKENYAKPAKAAPAPKTEEKPAPKKKSTSKKKAKKS